MLRYIALAAILIMCFTINTIAANINASHKSVIITKNSDIYNKISQWLQVYCREKYKAEMRNDGKVEIIDVTKITISPNENTYFVDFRGSSSL